MKNTHHNQEDDDLGDDHDDNHESATLLVGHINKKHDGFDLTTNSDTPYLHELSQSLCLSLPLIADLTIHVCQQLVAPMLFAHMTDTWSFVAVALSQVVFVVTYTAPTFAVLWALSVLGAVAAGSERYRNLGSIFWMSQFILFAFFIFVSIPAICFVMEPLLISLGVEKTLSYDAVWLARTALGYLPFFGMLWITTTTLVTLNRAYVTMWCSCIWFPFDLALAYTLVFHTPLGAPGAFIAHAISYSFYFAVLVAYLIKTNLAQRMELSSTFYIWRDWSAQGFKKLLKAFLSIALPSGLATMALLGVQMALPVMAALVNCSDDCSLSRNLRNESTSTKFESQQALKVAAAFVIVSAMSLGHVFWVAFQEMAVTRISLFMGARNVKGAKRAAHISLLVALVSGLIAMLIFYFVGERIAMIFVGSTMEADPSFVYTVDNSILFLAVSAPLVSLLFVGDGVLTSCGIVRVWFGCSIHLLSHFVLFPVFAMMLAYSNRFSHFEALNGLFVAYSLTLLVSVVAQFFVIAQLDWERIVQKEEEAKVLQDDEMFSG